MRLWAEHADVRDVSVTSHARTRHACARGRLGPSRRKGRQRCRTQGVVAPGDTIVVEGEGAARRETHVIAPPPTYFAAPSAEALLVPPRPTPAAAVAAALLPPHEAGKPPQHVDPAQQRKAAAAAAAKEGHGASEVGRPWPHRRHTWLERHSLAAQHAWRWRATLDRSSLRALRRRWCCPAACAARTQRRRARQVPRM